MANGVLTSLWICGPLPTGAMAAAVSEVTTPHFTEVAVREATVPYRKPKELIKRPLGAAHECKRYDAEPEDFTCVEELRTKFGDHLNVLDLETIIEELEREKFCSKDKIGR